MGKRKENKNEYVNVDVSKEVFDILEKIAKPISKLTYGEGENKLTIEVNPQPPIVKRIATQKIAANLLFNNKAPGIDAYEPFYYDLALRYGIILCYTNLILPNLDYAWTILNYSTIYTDVLEIIGEAEVDKFARDLRELIDARKQSIIHSINWINILDDIMDMLRDLGKNFKDLDINATLKGLKDISPEIINEFVNKKIKN